MIAETIFVKNKDFSIQENSGNFLLSNSSGSKQLLIDNRAAVILSLCDGEHSTEDIIVFLQKHYPEAGESLSNDVIETLNHLKKEQAVLVQVTETPSPNFVEKDYKLSIGMATYDDYDGVYFTIQALRLYHANVINDVELLVIDNNPSGLASEALKNLCNNSTNCRYVPYTEKTGTSAPRDYIFEVASAPYVMCVDSHILLDINVIQKLIKYFRKNPLSNDLLQGPLLDDGGTTIFTHWDPVWSKGMYGTWSIDDRGRKASNKPFEIPLQGLGLFACRKAVWLGFNPDFSGFGGEEGYIHEKFRQAGHRTLCLPFMRWMHRFNRPFGANYANTWEDRVRNYFIGYQELGLNSDKMEQHFSKLLDGEKVLRIKNMLEG